MNEFLAAPESGFPFLPIALAAQSLPAGLALHFFMKEAFAAPASGLPFLPIAFDSQLEGAGMGAVCANAEDVINKLARRNAVVRNIGLSG